MWALDYQVDLTADGRQVRFLNVIDELTREALATRAARSFNCDATVTVLDELVTTLGRRPEHIRMDNGTELTAYALGDWCRFNSVDPAYIDPGSPSFTGQGPGADIEFGRGLTFTDDVRVTTPPPDAAGAEPSRVLLNPPQLRLSSGLGGGAKLLSS